MKKVIVKVNLHDEKIKQKGMKAVSGLQGVESISMDMKDQKLTVIGDVDPVVVVNKIRKLCPADIVSVGPAKEEKKKEEPKKEEPKKDDQKKKEEELLKAIQACQAYTYPYMASQQYFVKSAEEDPNSCVIC